MNHHLARTSMSVAVLALLVFLGTNCSQPAPKSFHQTTEDSASISKQNLESQINLAAAGDFLMHMTIVESAWDNSNNRYDFDRMFDHVRPLLDASDYCVANLETCLAGPEQRYQGYPRFNSPDSLAATIQRLGIDLLTTANNHSLDMGWPGLLRTLNQLDQTQLAHTGTYRSQTERDAPFVVDIKGIRLGIVDYTATTNGIPLPKGRPYAVALLEEEQVQRDLARLRTLAPDLVVAFIHWGTEYRRTPDASQRKWARFLAQQGVDLIVGQHPHVVEPIEYLEVTNQIGEPHRCVVAYSVGNFISDQRWRYADSGIILHVSIVRDSSGDTSIRSIGYSPIWVDTYYTDQQRQFRVLAVPQAIADYDEGVDDLLTQEDYQRLLQVRDETAQLLDQPEIGIGPFKDPDAKDSPSSRCAATLKTSHET